MPPKNLLLIFFYLLSIISFIRVIKIATNTTTTTVSSSRRPGFPAALNQCTCEEEEDLSGSNVKLVAEEKFSRKEYRLLSKVISQRTPCNILFFGLRPQFLDLSMTNIGGNSVFLEDDPEKLMAIYSHPKEVQVYKVSYDQRAKEAFELLKHARGNNACYLYTGGGGGGGADQLRESECGLALTALPKVVYERRFDVIVVDGPAGDRPGEPGRMAAIYTAAALARAGGNGTDVLVHDVDRMIEKWYSWEFLCQENLVSSRGKLWHFRVNDQFKSGSFCSNAAFQIE